MKSFEEWVQQDSLFESNRDIELSPLAEHLSTMFGSFQLDTAGGTPYSASGMYCGVLFTFNTTVHGSHFIGKSENHVYEFTHPYVVSSHVEFAFMMKHMLPRLRSSLRVAADPLDWLHTVEHSDTFPDIDTDMEPYVRDGQTR